MLDDGESLSSLVSSMPSLPAVGLFGSFAECVPGTFTCSSIGSSLFSLAMRSRLIRLVLAEEEEAVKLTGKEV